MDNSNMFGYRSPSSFISNATGAAAGGGSIGSSASGPNGSGMFGGSPTGGNSSPGQRQSVRDYDDQLNTLRRENFNLKLRIYFLENNTPANLQVDGKDALYKQNVDLKVETEALRAELKEKQNLICEAATALNLIEQSQKQSQSEYETRVEELERKIQFLEQEIERREDLDVGASPMVVAATAANSQQLSEVLAQSSLNSEAQERIAELEACVQRLKDREADVDRQCREAECQVREHEELTRNAELQYTRLFVEHSELKERLEQSRLSSSHQSDSLTKINQTANDDSSLLKLRQQLADRECEISTLNDTLQEKSAAHETGCKMLQLLVKRVKTLEAELKTKALSSSPSSHPNHTVATSSLSADEASELHALREQIASARQEVAQANAWRLECSDVCTTLTLRLKELAEFLDTLLRNKDVLGVLAHDRRKAMRRAVDTSLNLSNSLHNMTVSGERFSLLNDTNLLEQLQAQLLGADMSTLSVNSSTAAAMANDSLENKENLFPSSSNVSSHGHQQLIESLRSEVRTLRAELQEQRSAAQNCIKIDDTFGTTGSISFDSSAKHSSNANNASRHRSHHKNAAAAQIKRERHSDSDASWSEPDRQVSQARIGLEDSAALRTGGGHASSGGTTAGVQRMSPKPVAGGVDLSGASSMSSLLSGSAGPQTKMQRMYDQLSEMELKLVQQENVMLKQQCAMVESDNRLKEERLALLAANRELVIVRETYEAKVSDLTDALANKLSECNALNASVDELRAQLGDCESRCAAAEKRATMCEADAEEAHQLHRQELASVRTIRLQLEESAAMIDFMREHEISLQSQLSEHEKQARSMKSALDESVLQCSTATLERARTLADKRAADAKCAQLQLDWDDAQSRIVELSKRIAQLEKLNAAMQNRLVLLGSGSGQSTSDKQRHQLSRSASSGTNFRFANLLLGASPPKSDELHSTSAQRLENSSPDLGIESDAGRTSGSDAGGTGAAACRRFNLSAPAATPSSHNRTVGSGSIAANLSAAIEELRFVEDDEENHIDAPAQQANVDTKTHHDCALVDREMAELKRKLAHTHQAHRQILQQLRISNNRKEQVERDIRREICKTQSVLQTVRTNIESASGVQAFRESPSPVKSTPHHQ